MTMVPEAWQNDYNMEPKKRDFYNWSAFAMEPWDGPGMCAAKIYIHQVVSQIRLYCSLSHVASSVASHVASCLVFQFLPFQVWVFLLSNVCQRRSHGFIRGGADILVCKHL